MANILILGGTQFIGRNLVEALQIDGRHTLTLFNRGRTQPHLFPEVNRIKGDRSTEDIQQIAEQEWDYVIDVSCYFPEDLKRSLDALSISPKRYVFISTCSVYDNSDKNITLRKETSPLFSCDDKQWVDTSDQSYGARKAACDRLLMESGLRYTILRPALVYGPYDPTDRLYYWLYQVKQHDPLLLPDKGNRRFSLSFVGDLIRMIISALEPASPSEIYTVVSHPEASIRRIVETASALMGKSPRTVNASPEFLREHEVGQWSDMALWIDGDHFTYDNQLMKTVVEVTEFGDSLAKTIAWYEGLDWPVPKFGMEEERRLGVLGKLSQGG